MTDRPPLPPFDLQAALAKVQAAEDAWNTLRKSLWGFRENRIAVRFQGLWDGLATGLAAGQRLGLSTRSAAV